MRTLDQSISKDILKDMGLQRNQSGFTIIELLVVILIVGILGTLVAMTYSGVQAKDRNKERRADINTLKSHLETYYAQHSVYPTLANMNDANWRKANLKELAASHLEDPSWNDTSKHCAKDGQVLLVGSPTEKCYAYQVRATDGSQCNNDKILCSQYTLTAVFEGGDRFVKSSLN